MRNTILVKLYSGKLYLIILYLLISITSKAQTFPYERVWGTYYGPTGSDYSIPFSQGGFLLDNQNNFHILGQVIKDSSLGAPYYNQYVTTGGQNINLSFFTAFLQAKFTESGNVLFAGFCDGTAPTNIREILVHIDGDGNYYYLKLALNNLSDVATPNAWFVNDPNISGNNQFHYLLYKKNNIGTVVWKTFLPLDILLNYSFVTDENKDLYITGATKIQQGIGTSGTFMENYQTYYNNGTILSNAFVVKLGSQGQLIWGTYLPVTASSYVLEYHNQRLYFVGGGDIDPAINQLATANAWQNIPTSQSLTAINSTTGARIWGTYLGSGLAGSSSAVTSCKANASGIYLFGNDFLSSSYFSTPGAYKSQVTGFTDYFLTKLDFNGNRIWGTYFGSDGMENIGISTNPMALTNQSIFIVGSNLGGGSNISTPGAYQTSIPTPGTGPANNFFFANFDLNGNLKWSSYYGGPNYQLGLNQNINIYANNDNFFYLVGSTRAGTGIATENAYQPQLPPNLGNENTGFLARFNLKGQLSVSESEELFSDIILYDNPNNGIFTIKGNILEKKDFSLKIYDFSGRLLYTQKLNKERKQRLNYQGRLHTGIYYVHVSAGKDFEKKIKMIVK